MPFLFGQPYTLRFQNWPAEGGSTSTSGKPMACPSSDPSPGLASVPLLPSHFCPPSPADPTHLHLTLAFAKVLSSEFPSHIRLRAAKGHTAQGNSLQFLHFQH